MLSQTVAHSNRHIALTSYINGLTSAISFFSSENSFSMQTIQKQKAIIRSSTNDGLWHYFASVDGAYQGIVTAGFTITINGKKYVTKHDYTTKQTNKTSEFGTWLHYVLQREGFNGGNVDNSDHGGLVIFNTSAFTIKLEANSNELEKVLNLKRFYYGDIKIKNIK